MKKNVIRTGD